MTALGLVQVAPPAATAASPSSAADSRYGVPSVGSALRKLLEDARAGRARATSPGDRWLVLRIEEALLGFDDIQQMATDEELQPPTYAGGTAGRASIRASRARALTPA
ncbi:MAG TPA: hypothetical protein VG455_06710 [Acidimicrobiales bacterium]|nr:hypothetical protein [Acidimicrobiales bacterium]